MAHPSLRGLTCAGFKGKIVSGTRRAMSSYLFLQLPPLSFTETLEVNMRMNLSIHRTEQAPRPALVLIPLAFLIVGLTLAGAALGAGEAPLWGELKAGPHAVGFMTFEEYDYSRTFQPKRDYFGEIIPGEKARPIQACVWYPAVEDAGATPVLFSDYAFSPPEDHSFYQFLSAVQNREVAWLHRILMNNQTAVLEALGTDMNAARDAKPSDGAFPLLIYACDFDRGIGENAVLCEYLASHGYVVATTHALSAVSVRSQPSAAGLEAMVGDTEYLIGALHGRDLIEPGKLGVIGYAGGGLAALLLQMRNYSVDAVVALEAGYTEEPRAEMVMTNPYYDIGRMTAPLLSVYAEGAVREAGEGEAREAAAAATGEVFKYARRVMAGIPGARGFELTTYGLISPMVMPPVESEPPVEGEPPVEDEPPAGAGAYETMCGHAINFLDNYVKGSEEAGARLAGSDLTVIEAEERPPTQDEYLAIIQGGNIEMAIEIYEKFTAIDPDLVLFPEANMNFAGYGMLQRGRTAEAVSLFKMNAEAYPQSANCWDSLAEAYMASGDSEQALRCVEKVLETLPNDPNLTDDLRQALETNAERYKEELTGEVDGESEAEGEGSE